MNSPEKLHQALNNLDSLPAVPAIAQKILAVKINSDEGERELLELISKDPAIMSKIIGLANSPLFGIGRHVLTLRDAATVLGSRRIMMVALGFAMMTSLRRQPAGRLDVQGLWQHSLSVAMTMDTMARMIPAAQRPADDEIYLAGLLHDIGFLVLDYIDPQLSDRFHEHLAANPDQPVEMVEAEMLETTHGALGAALGSHWNLPEPIIAVLSFHHGSPDRYADDNHALVRLVNLAEKLLPTFGIAEPVSPTITDEEWQALGIDPARQEEISERIEDHLSKISAMRD